MNDAGPPSEVTLRRLFGDCFILGCTAWGGYMALLAQVQTQFVNKRRWTTHKSFLDLIALVSMLPGPQAVNGVALLGYRLRGWSGFCSALAGILLPGFLFILALWKGYSYFSALRDVTYAVTVGVLPPLAMIIARAAHTQAKNAIRRPGEALLFCASVPAVLLFPFWGTAILVLLCGAAVSLLFFPAEAPAEAAAAPQNARPMRTSLLLCALPVLFILFNFFPSLLPDMLAAKVGLVFAGLSTSLFGGGLVMVPLLQGLIVNDFAWLDQATFNVALAASQLTPGPILSVATYVGMQMAGVGGAALATLGTYLPTAIISVGVSGISETLLSRPLFRRAMSGIRCVVVGLIAGAAIMLLLKLPILNFPWRVSGLVAAAAVLVFVCKAPPYVSLPISCALAWLLF